MWFLYQCLSSLSAASPILLAMLILPTDSEKFIAVKENYSAAGNRAKSEKLSVSEFHQLAIACSVMQEVLRFHQSKGNIADAAGAWLRLGDIYQQMYQFTNALSSYQQAIEHYRLVEDKMGEIKTLGHVGKVYEQQGWFNCALEYYEQALAKLRQHTDYLNQAVTLDHLAILIEETI
jgi:tetratricopeptide (TPR) repeat protein